MIKKTRFVITLSAVLLLLVTFSWAVSADDFYTLCKEGTPQEIQQAIDDGAEVNQQNEDGVTPLMTAARHNNNYEAVLTLYNNGAYVNSRDNEGWNALMYAVRYNDNKDVVRILLRMNSRVNIDDTDGTTPLILAVKYRDEEIVRMLLNYGANVTRANNRGET